MKRIAHLFAAILALIAVPACAANRKPLVLSNGQIQQLQPGDTLSLAIPDVSGVAVPHVTSKTALQGVSTANATVIVRDGYAAPGDAPPLTYLASGSACSLNAGAGDGGSQVPSADSKCWLASFPSTGADIRQWGVVMDGATSADAALVKAAAWAGANNSQTLVAPAGQIAITGAATIPLNHVSLLCTAGGPDADDAGAAIGTHGTVFVLTSTSVQPFTLQAGVKISGCAFYWPNQNGSTVNPIVYPPLFTEPAGQQMQSDYFTGIRLINAYDFIVEGSADDAVGNLFMSDVQGYVIHTFMRVAQVGDTIVINNLILDSALYQAVANTGNSYLQKWTAANGTLLDVYGNGNGTTTTSTAQAIGVSVSNSSLFAYRYAVHVESTGFLTESTFKGTIFDAVPTVFQVDTGGCSAQNVFDGSYWGFQYKGDGTDHSPLFSLGAGPSSGCAGGVEIRGQLEQTQGDVVDLTGANWSTISLSLDGGWYGQSSTVTDYYFANINSGSVRANIFGNYIQPFASDSRHKGLLLTACNMCSVNGNQFLGVYNPIDTASNAAPIILTGNVSKTTGSTYSVVGSGTNVISQANNWDLPNPTYDGQLKLGTSVLNTSAASVSCTGLGTGSCSLLSGSTGLSGIISMAPTGSPSNTGVVTLTLPAAGAHLGVCVFNMQNGSANWNSAATFYMEAADSGHTGPHWYNNAVNLTAGQTYFFAYQCIPN